MRVIGYIVAVVGIVVIALGSGFFGEIDLFGIGSLYISGAGVVLVVVGIVISLKDNRVRGKQKREEVPIYRGKKIVGYRLR